MTTHRAPSAVEPETRAMAGIALGVAAGSALAPKLFLRLFGIQDAPDGAAKLGWRLFAVRNVGVGVAALQGSTTARDLFLPVQVLDQVAWWTGLRRGELTKRTTFMAAAASGVIIALDLRRRVR